jgi:hypothetical protein
MVPPRKMMCEWWIFHICLMLAYWRALGYRDNIINNGDTIGFHRWDNNCIFSNVNSGLMFTPATWLLIVRKGYHSSSK